jgi:hypothetical protein
MNIFRFIDEQESGRDRSASPNYHSLIYGDTKRKSEGEHCTWTPVYLIFEGVKNLPNPDNAGEIVKLLGKGGG